MARSVNSNKPDYKLIGKNIKGYAISPRQLFDKKKGHMFHTALRLVKVREMENAA